MNTFEIYFRFLLWLFHFTFQGDNSSFFYIKSANCNIRGTANSFAMLRQKTRCFGKRIFFFRQFIPSLMKNAPIIELFPKYCFPGQNFGFFNKSKKLSFSSVLRQNSDVFLKVRGLNYNSFNNCFLNRKVESMPGSQGRRVGNYLWFG